MTRRDFITCIILFIVVIFIVALLKIILPDSQNVIRYTSNYNYNYNTNDNINKIASPSDNENNIIGFLAVGLITFLFIF